MYVSILSYGRRRYLWVALALAVASIALYLTQNPGAPPSGGTWQGYTLGGLGAFMIVWLAWLGVRKRRYRSGFGSVQGWASAHVYLGLTLPLIALLHSAFQIGWNIHTLALLLMLAVIASGIYGLYAYLRMPLFLVRNRADSSLDERLEELDRADKNILETAGQSEPVVFEVMTSTLDNTAIGGSLWDQLRARDRSKVSLPSSADRDKHRGLVANNDQQVAIDYIVAKIPDTSKPGEAQRLRQLLTLLGRRAELLRRIRREQSLQVRLKFWLCFHIPLTIALLVALVAHVLSVFFYW